MTRYRVHLSKKSENKKTGPIPVSTTTADTCPPKCPLLGNGCYAGLGNLALHWRNVTRGYFDGFSWEDFCRAIAALPEKQIWRHNQAGDLPGDGVRVDREALSALADANAGKRGFTYTHYDVSSNTAAALANTVAIRSAIATGFTVNASCESAAQADAAIAHGLPAVLVLPENAPDGMRTPAGTPIVVCPAQRRDSVTCQTCGLCAISNRKSVVGFLAHGISKRKVTALVSGEGA